MTTESVASVAAPKAVDDARALIAEALAIQEMAWRTKNENEEDFDMLNKACYVTFRLLNEAEGLLEGALK